MENSTYLENHGDEDHEGDYNYCYEAKTLESVPSSTGRLFLIILYTCTSLLAFLGNVTVIVVEVYGKESAPNIRKYLINLAVSDIIISVVCVPFTYTDFMLGQWIFPHWLCPAAQYVQLLSVFVTSLTLTIIGVERYLATLHPFTWAFQWVSRHTGFILTGVWAIGAVYAYIPYENTFAKSFILDDNIYYECSYDNDVSELKRRFFMTSNFALTFAIRLVVLIFSYSAMMRKLMSNKCQLSTSFRRNRSNQTDRSLSCGSVESFTATTSFCIVTTNGNSNLLKHSTLNIYGQTNVIKTFGGNNNNVRKSSPFKHRSRSIKMMFIVILLFTICWAPIKLYQFLLDYNLIQYCSEAQFHIIIVVYFVCHWTAMANSFVNPIIYSFMSQSFRSDFRKITRKLCQSLKN